LVCHPLRAIAPRAPQNSDSDAKGSENPASHVMAFFSRNVFLSATLACISGRIAAVH